MYIHFSRGKNAADSIATDTARKRFWQQQQHNLCSRSFFVVPLVATLGLWGRRGSFLKHFDSPLCGPRAVRKTLRRMAVPYYWERVEAGVDDDG